MTDADILKGFIRGEDGIYPFQASKVYVNLHETDKIQLQQIISTLSKDAATNLLWQLCQGPWRTWKPIDIFLETLLPISDTDPDIIWFWELNSRLSDLAVSMDLATLRRVSELLDRNVKVGEQINLNKDMGNNLHQFFDLIGFSDTFSDDLLKEVAGFSKVLSKIKLAKQTQLEHIIARVLGAAGKIDDQAAIAECVKCSPKTPKNKSLAFNLACVAARDKNEAEMLRLVRIARKLGKEEYAFEYDEDFKAFFATPEFQAALQSGE